MSDNTFTIVIVTFNRLELLKECLKHVYNQNLKPKHIVVVDNASTDGTGDYLDGIDNETITILHEDKNIGGSGGFHDGVALAMETGDQWIVLIDDDAMLSENYLELIYEQYAENKIAQAYSGKVVTDGEIILEHRRRLTTGFHAGEKAVDLDEYEKEIFEYDLCSFCGLALNRQVIEQIGIPRNDFFIWYDDTEYCLRFRCITKIININKAYVDHRTTTAHVRNEDKKFYSWRRYYGFRNVIAAFLINRCYWIAFKRIYNQLRDGIKYTRDKEIDKTVSAYNLRMRIEGTRDALIGKMGINNKYGPEIKK